MPDGDDRIEVENVNAPGRTTRLDRDKYEAKGADLSLHGPDEFEAVGLALNGRPRRTFGWRPPPRYWTPICPPLKVPLLRRPNETALRSLDALLWVKRLLPVIG